LEGQVIKSFKGKAAEYLYHDLHSSEARKLPENIRKAAGRKLDMLNSADELIRGLYET